MPGWFDKASPRDMKALRFFTGEGELTHLQLVPVPMQKPGPPIWIMAELEKSNAEAARRSLGVLSYAQSFEQMRAAWSAYREAFVPSATTPKERLAMMRPISWRIARLEAEAVMRPAINSMMQAGPRANADPVNARKLFLASTEHLDDADMKGDWFDFLVRRGHVHVRLPRICDRSPETLPVGAWLRAFRVALGRATVTFEQYRSSLTLLPFGEGHAEIFVVRLGVSNRDRYLQAWDKAFNRGNPDAFDPIVAADYVRHYSQSPGFGSRMWRASKRPCCRCVTVSPISARRSMTSSGRTASSRSAGRAKGPTSIHFSAFLRRASAS